MQETVQLPFIFNFPTAGENHLEIELRGTGFSDKKSVLLNVYEEPKVVVEEILFKTSGTSVAVTLNIAKTDSVPSVYVTVAGQKQKLSSGSASFLVKPGKHTVELAWSDVSGKEYSSEMPLDVPEAPAVMDSSIPFFVSVFVLFMVALMLLGISTMIFNMRKR